METFKFDCGCEIPIVDDVPQIDFNNLNYSCQRTWDLYGKGHTESVFQLNSYLGKRYTKEMEPKDLEDAAALIAIIRPGILQIKDGKGTSLTQAYCEIKRGVRDPIDNEIYHTSPTTNGILIYQEEVMVIAQKLAGFSAVESLKFMKTMAKKDSEKLLTFGKKFIDGCMNKSGLDKETAEKIFENIKSSGRYIFNKSHSVSYAVLGYQTAWAKAHFPYHYLCAWLRHAKGQPKPQEEIRKLAGEARRLKIPFKPPNISNYPNLDFFIKERSVYFGLDSIKGCGQKTFNKVPEMIDFDDMNWVEFLIMNSHFFNKTQIKNMIKTGCFDHMNKTRIECEFEYDQWIQLTDTEKKKVRAKYADELHLSILEAIESIEPMKRRKDTVDAIKYSLIKPPINLKDSKANIVENERQLLGVNISCSKIKKSSIPPNANRCKDVNEALYNDLNVVGEISEFRSFKIKNGKLKGQFMASFRLIDDHGDECDIVCFPKELEKFEPAMYDGNIILIEGQLSNRGGLIVNNLFEV